MTIKIVGWLLDLFGYRVHCRYYTKLHSRIVVELWEISWRSSESGEISKATRSASEEHVIVSERA